MWRVELGWAPAAVAVVARELVVAAAAAALVVFHVPASTASGAF